MKCATLALILASLPLPAAAFHVVIDPGHGGLDHGTRFTSPALTITEKEVTLQLAQALQSELKKFGITATLTRTKDEDIPLAQRTALANRLKADLFLSIHLNSGAAHTKSVKAATRGKAKLPSIEGIETYILNHTSDASSKRLAELENQSGHPSPLAGSGYTDNANPDVALILKDLRLDANLPRSQIFACAIQRQLGALGKNRGVKQALFYVLLGADMPSALLEAGFLNNPRDRARVLSREGQRSIGLGISRAIVAYRDQRNSPQALSTCPIH